MFMTDARKQTGDRSETLAARYLETRGYRLLERNFRCRAGEADIIALDGEVLAVIEVKSLKSDFLRTPLEKVDHRKQKRLARVAECYVKKTSETQRNIRFDVVAVDLTNTDGEEPRILLLKDAFRLW